MTGILSLLAAAVGVFLTGRLSGIKYLHAGGGALVTAALAMLFGAPLWATIACSVIVAVTVYVAIWRRASGMRTMPALVSGGALLTAIALVAGIVGFMGMSSPTAQANATDVPDQSVINSLIIHTTTVTCKTDAYGLITPWDIGALKPVGKGGRVNSDDVSTPVAATTAAGVVNEAQRRICNDPLYGSHWAYFFAHLWKGALVQVNPWLQPFAGTGDTVINTEAATFTPVIDVKQPTAKQSADAIDGNKRWQSVAPKIATLLGRLTPVGIEAMPSILNYHVLNGGLVVGKLPAIGLNKDVPDNLSAAVLVVTEKGKAQCVLEVGINREDGRAEEGTCSPSPSGTPTTPGTPTHPGTPGTPTPGCTSGCTTTPPTPTPTPSCPVFTSPKGTCYGHKTPAPQASGVSKPTSSGPGTVNNTPPPPKPTPLKPSSGSGGGGSQPTAPGATPVPSYSPPPLNTGAPAPSQAPTSAPCAPGTC